MSRLFAEPQYKIILWQKYLLTMAEIKDLFIYTGMIRSVQLCEGVQLCVYCVSKKGLIQHYVAFK